MCLLWPRHFSNFRAECCVKKLNNEVTYVLDDFLEEASDLEIHYGCHTGSASLVLIQSLDGTFQGCLYTIENQSYDGVYCFKENGDYPSECLIGKVSNLFWGKL